MRVAVVTGGTRGIGLAIADALARDGYGGLVLGYNANVAAAEAARARLTAAHPGLQVYCVAGDVALAATAEALFECVRSQLGGACTALVHNAGLILRARTSPGAHQPERGHDDWEAAWDYYQNVYPKCFRRLVGLARQGGGLRHVLAVSGQGCNATTKPHVGYQLPGQAKASMEFLVRILARELGKDGVNVNCLVPGYTKTEAVDCLVATLNIPAEAMQKAAEAAPLGRWGQPEEIAEAAAFLCSARGAWITGVALPVDGGMHLT